MPNPSVQFYLQIAAALAQPVNLDIIDPVAEDFVPGLAPEALARAVYEVDVLQQCQTVQEWLSRITNVRRVNLLADRVATAQAAASAAQTDATSALGGIGNASAAATMAQSTANAAASTAASAAATAATASTTATAAQTAAASAQAAANTAAAAATNAQTTANQALAAAGSGANMPRAVVRATNLSTISVPVLAGAQTHVPFPAGSLRGAPLTRPSADFELVNGVLRINTAGVYSYDFSAIFTAGLLTASVFRFQLALGTNLATPATRVVEADESATHTAQLAVLSAAAGINGGGTFQVPTGGRDFALLVGHAALAATGLTITDLRISVRRIGDV